MKVNESYRQRASAFVQRLLANPSLEGFVPLQREEQIIQFLSLNCRQLYPTLSSNNFFPGQSWEKINSILLSALYDITSNDTLKELKIFVDGLDLSFFGLLGKTIFDEAEAKQAVFTLIKKILSNEQARRVFAGSAAAVKNNFTRKYINEIYQMRRYIHFEVVKVERLKVGEKEAENMINLVILLKPLIYMFSAQGLTGKHTNYGQVFTNSSALNIAKALVKNNSILPEQLIISAMNANTSFAENTKLEATARLANILTAMCRNYKTEAKKDRGADTAMKSWINVAKKNYKFYGYDIKMLDELYNIASDNDW